MKILFVNKYLYQYGGVERYLFKLVQLLKEKNHKIIYFSMADPRNIKTKWSKYFIKNISFSDKIKFQDITKLLHMLYSRESRRKINELFCHITPDLVHLRSIYHHISPSILPELGKRNIPVVQTLGDYHLISPNYNLFHNGKICEITRPNAYYKAIFHKCVKNSYLLSAAEVIEKYIHSALGWELKYIDYFIAPSKFMKKILISYGIPDNKIVHIPHFINYREYSIAKKIGDYVLYFGRLSPEKGLDFLIKVFKNLPKVNLMIVGKGKDTERLVNQAHSNKLSNVKFSGFADRKKLRAIISRSRFTILPSLWYENSPNSLLESFASGKPALGSNIGGIPEMIINNYNGFLFEPGNIDDCKEKILKLWNNQNLCFKMGRNARRYVEENYGPEKHYERLIEVYKKAMDLHKL